MSNISTDPSVDKEPHLQKDSFLSDASEKKADKVFAKRKTTIDQTVEQSVWDEPSLSTVLTGKPSEYSLTYANWLTDRKATTTHQKSFLVTLLIIIASGPWAIVGVFFLAFSGYGGGFGIASIIIFGPVMEELLKISSTLITIEKKPYLFKSKTQIFICCLLSGLIFAFFENLLYLHVYIQNPSPMLVLWRWTICVLLHATCTSISSIGLIKVWSKTEKNLTKPSLPLMSKYVLAACIIHGCYNALALVLNPFFQS